MSMNFARSAVFVRTGRVLSITCVEGIHRHRNVLLQLDVHWNVPSWYECSTQKKLCEQVCARTSVS